MRLVPGDLIGSQRCAVSKRTKDRRGFFHTNQVLEGLDPEVFLSAAVVEEMAKQIGMVPEAEVNALKERVEKWEADCADLRGRLDGLDQIEALKEKVMA